MGDFNYPETKLQTRRINLIVGLMFMIGAAMVLRLVQLQVFKSSDYRAQAAKSHSRKFEVPATRGEIFAQDGDRVAPLAMNETEFLLYADPSLIADDKKPQMAIELAKITGADAAGYLTKMRVRGAYSVLTRRISKQHADKIRSLKLFGIGLTQAAARTYPEGDLAAQVIGFVNAEGLGQYGIEQQFNKDLSGKAGLLKAVTDTQGNPVPTAKNTIRPPVDGSDIVLTIDRNIQAQVEKHLEEGVKAVGATSGSVIVVNPRSGKIMAMANYPSYNPAEFNKTKDVNNFGNQAVSSTFEPGSGFKAFTMAAGLDTGKVKPDTEYTDTGEFKSDGYIVNNSLKKKYGKQTMADVIQKSLNTGVIHVLKQLGGDPEKITPSGKKVFHDYIKKFGFGRPTGITLPGEGGGKGLGFIPIPGSRDINYANMTFGQGLSSTMTQMVMAVTAIANGGKLYQPQIVDRVISPDGKVQQVPPVVVNNQVINAEAARQLRAMMVNVVEHGSGYLAKIPGYKIAGKTGTAQVAKVDGTGYDEKKNIGTFVGFLPADNPEFVMMVRINEPKVSGFAESTTVPVFADISGYLVKYLRIAPR